MEFYLFILIVLFFTAIADLIVGVANDAVNFLNSAIGSRVATRRTIMIIASVGILLGTTFSSGMMEVARKGVFKPEFFTMHEVIIIFLSVMLTDILLLDLYNSFGLPTSTTVSIVFEIFGGAIAIGAVKSFQTDMAFSNVFSYINTTSIITIIAGIGLSVIFAFIFGVIIQFFTRLIFTFNYEKVFKRFGGIYSALALTAITYFIVIKGAKGASFLTKEQSKWLVIHIKEIAFCSFLLWGIVWQILISFTRINVLKIIVLIGTFALAFSFAANDLVNFIGAPLGGLSAYEAALTTGEAPKNLLMNALNEPARANTIILLMAGFVMAITLWRSKKAQSVTKTEVSLGRQEEGIERFDSSLLSRGIVRIFISFGELVLKITPAGIRRMVQNRIDPQKYQPVPDEEGKTPAFDLLRAAVNLMVSSALISFGTSLKLPLSTTFVTFMVAMSTSLADKSWGRESAVYRVTGVLTVIGGWFFTAFMAFTTCFLFTLFIFYLGLPAIIILITAGFYFLYRSSRLHKNREAAFERKELARTNLLTIFDQFTHILHEISDFLIITGNSMNEIIHGLIDGKRKKLKLAMNLVTEIENESNKLTDNIFNYIKTAIDDEKGSASRYALMIGGLQTISSHLSALSNKIFKHTNNNHQVPTEEQSSELIEMEVRLQELIQTAAMMLKKQKFSEYENFEQSIDNFKDMLQKFNKQQIKRIKKHQSGSRQSLIFFNTLSKVERIVEQIKNIIKANANAGVEVQD